MKTYYVVYPRNFANEYSVVYADSNNTQHQELLNYLIEQSEDDPNFSCDRISRKEAYSMTAANRKAYRTGEANYNNPAGATKIESINIYFDLIK